MLRLIYGIILVGNNNQRAFTISFLWPTSIINPSKLVCLQIYLPTDKKTQTINNSPTPSPLICSAMITEQTLSINYSLSVQNKSGMYVCWLMSHFRLIGQVLLVSAVDDKIPMLTNYQQFVCAVICHCLAWSGTVPFIFPPFAKDDDHENDFSAWQQHKSRMKAGKVILTVLFCFVFFFVFFMAVTFLKPFYTN